MVIRIYPITITCLICICLAKLSAAQSLPSDTSARQSAFNNAIALYHSAIGAQSLLYNGPEYYFYDPNIKSNAYFLDVNGFTAGSIFYDGALYKGTQMLYDLYSDNVAVVLFNHYSKFSLIKEKVKSFDYLGHHFINIIADTISGNVKLKAGYYDEIYNGKLQVLVKRSKSIQVNSNGTAGIESYFTAATREIYLKKNDSYYAISNEGVILNILKDKKRELQQFIKSSQIKFRKDPEDAMIKISSFYDNLAK